MMANEFLSKAKGGIKKMLLETWTGQDTNDGVLVQVIKVIPADGMALLELSDGINSCAASINNTVFPSDPRDVTSRGPPGRSQILCIDAWHRVSSDSDPIKILSCQCSGETPSTIYGTPRKVSSAAKDTVVFIGEGGALDLGSTLDQSAAIPTARLLSQSFESFIKRRPEAEQPMFYQALISALVSQQSLSFFLARSNPDFASAVGRYLDTEQLRTHFLINFSSLSKNLSVPLPDSIARGRDTLEDLCVLLRGIERVARQPVKKVAGKGSKAEGEAPLSLYYEVETLAFDRQCPDRKIPVEKDEIEYRLERIHKRCKAYIGFLVKWLAACGPSYEDLIHRVFLETLATTPQPQAPEPAKKEKAPKIKRKISAPIVPLLEVKTEPVRAKNKRNRAPTNDGMTSLANDATLRPEPTVSAQPALKRPATTSSKSQTQTPVFVPPPLAVAATTPALFQTTSLTTSTRSIMPLRAARLFDSSESDFGPWHIVLSGRCIQDWRGLKDSAKLNAVENVLVALSKGDFGPTNHKRLIHESDIIIYEAKVLSDLRMVYQIDLEDGLEGESVKQILRIWGLESHSSLDKRVWSAIGRYTARRGPEYRRRVNYRLAPNFKGATSRPFSLPASFPAVANESVGPVEAVGDLTEAEMLKVHELLALGKYIPFSKAVARSVLAQDDEAVHLFQLSPLEKTVVYHDSSAFVIGRSGTGKTTSILLRILSYQKAEEAHPNIMETFLRQVFITQSNLLASKVRKYYESIWRTFASSGLSKEEAAKLAIARATAARDDLEDVEDESAGLRGLPSRFSELTAEHYPLFVSWDTLVLLLENDYNIMWGAKRKRSEGHRQIFKKFKLENAVDVMAQLGVGNEPIDDLEEPEDDDTLSSMSRLFDHYIDADVFTSWWPSFNQQLTKGIEPALCWNEILGTICGSEASIDTQGGYLSREEYLQLSERAHSTYASHRGAIYSIFEAYRVRKNSQDDFDRSDRTHELIRQLKQRPIPRGSQLHMVSVDEAQDLLLADFRLLRHLCSNPKGWIWAGDTAQTINSGSSFRFDDLKASMFRQEVLAASSTDREPVNPDIFKLSLNYRSHCGITRMADSLVKAITKLFPNTIDVLPPEEGKVDGPAPVWIASGDESEGQSRSFSSFLFGETGSPVEFGAEQCILVRNDAARDRLRARTGDMGLIMTIAESKGLEFTEYIHAGTSTLAAMLTPLRSVLLFDFFSDSSASASDWRIMLSLFKGHGEGGVPKLDPIRHAIIAQELRFLYVACTRARSVLWLADRNKTGDAVKQYFEHGGVIRVCKPTDELPVIAATSSPEQWLKQARVMFDRQFYKNAVFCYDKAGASFEKEVAEAFEARRVLRVNARSKVGRVDVGAYALVAAKFRAAADKATGTQAKNLYRPCGELFLQAKRMEEAARAFELGDNFEQAAILFLNLGKKFHDDAIRIVKTGKTTSTTREKVQQTCRLHYLKHSRLDKARDLFESDEELLEYMTDYDFEDARVAFYISVGRFADAANIEISAGNLQAAADLFHQEGDHLSEASNLVRLVTGLLPFGISLSQKSQQVKAALSAIKQATEAASNLQVDFKPQLARYNAACAPYLDVNVLLPLAVECAGRRDHLGQLYCLELALSVHPDLNAPSSVRRYLLEFGNYTGLIKTLSTESAFSDNSLLFFGISVNPSSDELLILPQCPFATSDTSTTRELAQGLCQQYLLEHLEKRLTEMSRALLGYSAVRIPCVEFSLSQTCTTSPCPRAHFTKSEFTKGLRDRTEILQLILGLLPTYTFIATNLPDSATDARERVKTVQKAEQMRWDSVFVQTIHPPHPSCGALLDAQDTPGFDITAKNVASRAQDRLFEIKINDQSAWYTFLSSAIIASDFSQESFRRYIYRVPIAKWPKGRFYLAHDRRATTEILASYLATPLRADLNGGTLWNVFYVLQSIVEREMVVDLSLLIFFIEDLSALSLLRAPSEAVQVNSWDGIMAPRDFLRRMLRRHSQRTVVGVSLSLKRHLLTLMEKLCAHVYEGNSYLRYNGIALPGTGFMRNVFAFRLIRAMALIGTRSPKHVQDEVGGSLSRLQTEFGPRTWSSITNSFYKASNFEALAQAVGTASNLFELDKFLVIDFYGRPPRYSANRIDAKNLAEVEARLFSSSTLSATASPFIPFLPPHETPILDADEDVEVTDTKLQKAPDIVEPTPQEKAQQEAVNAAEQARQGAAARVIVKHVRSYAERRRQRKSHDSMPHILLWATYSSLCAPKRLKPVVLGPLVEIVFSLQGQIRRIQAAKNLLKKMRQDAEGDDLLKVADQTTAINKLRKTLDKFLDPLTIAPKSTTAKPMVSKGNILDLRVHLKGCRDIFLETEQLLREIHGVEPQPSHLALRTFFDLGEKGILTLPKARASKPTESKPEMGAMDAVAVEGDEEEAERLGRERAR